jgi:hypothetical protein
MFDIDDIQGCSFRDTLENLRKLREAKDNARLRLRPNGSEQEPRLIPANTSGTTGKAPVSSKAIEAYREMRHLNQREPV